jgi:uncharacterized protein
MMRNMTLANIKPQHTLTRDTVAQAVEHARALHAQFGSQLNQMVVQQYAERLSLDGYHGPQHWERVLLNGLILYRLLPERVCPYTMYLFALFHDSKRQDEGVDRLHGLRGSVYFERLVKLNAIPFPDTLNPAQQQQIVAWTSFAIERHTNTLFSSVSQIAACWDADRLDLMRVGNYPDRAKLNYASAMSDTLIYDSSIRAHKASTLGVFHEE